MQQPKLLTIIASIAVILLVGLWWSWHHATSSTNSNVASTEQTAWNMEAGDTNNEVLRTVVANQEKLQTQNRQLQATNAALQTQLNNGEEKILHQTEAQLQASITATKAELENQLANLPQSQTNTLNTSRYPIDVRTPVAPNAPIGDVSDLSTNAASIGMDSNAKISPSVITSNASTQTNALQPMFTLPAGATLTHVALMTALIGEVPVSGRLVEPAFPFKAIVGRKELLAANGVRLPADISGMVVQGYSVGNMTMSCTRAYVTRVLFVFQDGHFVVWPNQQTDAAATELYPAQSLGFLSTQYGNPCLPGNYITDAPKVIANMAALGGVANLGNLIAQQQTTTVSTGFQSSENLTGSLGQYAAGAFAGGASNAALAWYNNRVSDIFDAVYIPAAFYNAAHHAVPTEVVFNVTSTIPIDLNIKGRLLDARLNDASNINATLD